MIGLGRGICDPSRHVQNGMICRKGAETMVNGLAYLSLPDTVLLLPRQALGNLWSFLPRGVLRWFLMVLTFGGGKVQRRLYESIGVKAAAFFLHVFV